MQRINHVLLSLEPIHAFQSSMAPASRQITPELEWSPLYAMDAIEVAVKCGVFLYGEISERT